LLCGTSSPAVNSGSSPPPLMSIPGVGQLTALAFTAAVDDPGRFRRSRDIGAYLGLVLGAISRGRWTTRAASRSAATDGTGRGTKTVTRAQARSAAVGLASGPSPRRLGTPRTRRKPTCQNPGRPSAFDVLPLCTTDGSGGYGGVRPSMSGCSLRDCRNLHRQFIPEGLCYRFTSPPEPSSAPPRATAA
jgi:transposase IS116/IS110/IS902 family protein